MSLLLSPLFCLKNNQGAMLQAIGCIKNMQAIFAFLRGICLEKAVDA